MKRIGKTLCGMLVAAAVCAAGVGAGRLVAQETAPAAVAHDEAFFNDLVDRLGNADASVKAQAQQDLAQVGAADMELLQKIADKAADEEVKTRLNARLTEIGEQTAANPAPISLEVNNAQLYDVAQALGKAAGIRIETWRQNGGPTYTLSVKDKPFWEVFTELSKQHGIWIEGWNGLRMNPSEPGFRNAVLVGKGFAFFPMTITRSKTSDFQRADGQESQPEQMNFNYALAVDPRIRIVKWQPPIFTEAKDENGNDLAGPQQNRGTNMWEIQQGQCFFQQGTQLKIPDNMGKKLVSLKGSATFLIQVAEERLLVDPKEKMNEALTINGRTATITRFETNGNNIQFQINADSMYGGRGRTQKAPLRMEFVDADGKIVWQTTLNGGSGGSTGGEFKEPVKIRFASSTKTKELTVDFELKDLPLP